MAANNPSGLTRKALVVWIAMSLGLTLLAADDSPREQLDRLRAEHRYDAAIEYLEQLQEAPDAPQDLKRIVLFEMGSTLFEAAIRDREPIRRRSRLGAASASFREFFKKHPNHPLVASARDKLGNVLIEMARFSFEQAKKHPLDRPDDQSLLEEARSHFSEASAIYQANLADLRAKLTEIPSILDPMDPEQRKLLEMRRQYRADYLQASLLIPAITEEQAGTYPADAKGREEFLEDAAASYEDIYRRYRSRLAGLYARMYQGRCYVKLGQHERALEVFDELLAQPNSPAFWNLRQKVFVLAAECWLDDSQKNYQGAIGQLGELLDNLNVEQTKTPDALQLRFALARAHQRFAEQIAEDSPDDPRIAESRQQAIKHARLVALQSDRHRAAASSLLAELGAEDPLEHADIGELKTFAELKSLGRQSMDRLQRAMIDSQRLTARLKFETDANLKDALQQRLERANSTARSARDLALAAYQRALKLTDDEPIESVNQVRYYTCYILYLKAKYRAAAEMGSELVRKYPASRGAPQSAQIAFASYLQLHANSASDKQRALVLKQLRDFGKYILEHWDDQPVGEDVRKTLQRLE